MITMGVDNYERGDIKALYFGAKVFITGASGFVGKVLIESLLRKTEVEKIFVLVRNKRNKTTQERIKDMMKEAVFKNLRKDYPERLSAIVPINGDCSLPNLGISEADTKTLIEEVEIIFHGAATVTFNENLKLATQINVNGTHCIMELARQMPNLKVVMHVSTAYSNCQLNEINEQIYPVDKKVDIIKLTDAIDAETAHKITKLIIGDSPNTYVYTKRAAEDLIERKYKDMPVGIVRPGVVIGSLKEPFPGWIDNLYGPTGLVIGLQSGVIHYTVIRYESLADMVPVDFVTNIMIAGAWDTYTSHIINGPGQKVPVYNVVSSPLAPTSWGKFQDKIIEDGQRAAPGKALWHPFAFTTTCWPIFRFFTLLLHYLPAYILDTILTFTGQQIKWKKVYGRVDDVMDVLIPFCTRQWVFGVHNIEALRKKMTSQERELFPFDFKTFDWESYLKIYFKGVREHMMKDTITDEDSKKKAKMLLFIHRCFLALQLLIIGFILYYLFSSHLRPQDSEGDYYPYNPSEW